jgi:hypothetical protein
MNLGLNQLKNLPESPQELKRRYTQSLIKLGYSKTNLPPLWVYNLYQALKPGGKKLNDTTIPFYSATKHGLSYFTSIISTNVPNSKGKSMTIIEYVENTYGKKSSDLTNQISPLSPKIQNINPQPEADQELLYLYYKLDALKSLSVDPSLDFQPALSQHSDKLAGIREAIDLTTKKGPSPSISPSF